MEDALHRALLEGVIDHAALFPPASMTMAQALAEDATARGSEYGWMIDRFVCPASRLDELEGLTAPVSVVVDDEAALPQRAASIETRLGAPRPEPRDLLSAAQALRPRSEEVYFELVLGDRWRDTIPATIGALAAVGGRVKLRCGGHTVPTSEQVALVLAACRGARVVMKATAGLHHALRSEEQHGFLNLLCAATHAHSRATDERGLQEILDARALADLPLGDLGPDEAREARLRLFKGFGSCSWREPVDELRSLGWLR